MMGNGMMNGGNMMMGWGGLFIGPLMMIAFLTLIVFAIVMLVKGMSGSNSNHHSSHGSLNILKERRASGEINQVEYEDIKRQLQV